MRRWLPGLTAFGAIAFALLAVELVPWSTLGRTDFAPFVMTITDWNAVRAQFSDGRTVSGTSVSRLEYRSRDSWTITLVSDEVGGRPGVETPDAYGCRNGAYGHFDAAGGFHISDYAPRPCPGPSRWLAYGEAWSMPWAKSVSDGVVTYEDTGERVSFDVRTGFPIVYEEGLITGSEPARRTTFQVEQP
jgi:hypothetical protein